MSGINLRDVHGADQLELLTSKRDRMVSIYRPGDNPIYRDGREFIANITVVTDPNGDVSIGILHSPSDDIEVQFIDENEESHNA